MRMFFMYLISAVMVVTIAIFAYQFERWVNWNVGYEIKVKETIEQMVKKECLNESAQDNDR